MIVVLAKKRKQTSCTKMQYPTLMYSLRGGGVGAGVGGGGVGLGPLKNNFFVIISLFRRLRTS